MPTVIQISSFQIPDCNFLGTTCKLRRYYDGDWQDVDGVLHLQGTVGNSTDFFDEVNCTLAGNTVTVPSFNATPTLSGLINPNVRETWQLWDEAGSARNIIADGWFIPASPSSITRGALEIENRGQALLWPPPVYLNALQVQQLIDAQIGTLNDASDVIKGRTFLDVAPTVAGSPRAIGTNSPTVPAFVIHTSKYASLNAAKTAMDLLGGGTIVVDSATPVTSNVSLPATTALRFEGQGILTGSSKTVTIVGPLDAPPRQLWQSGITVLFTGNTSITAYFAEWWGAKGDDLTASAAGNSVAWNATLSSVPDGAVIRPPIKAIYRLNSTVHFDNKYSVTINSGVVKSDGTNAPAFRWAGTGGKLMTVSEGFLNAILGMTFDLAPGATVDKFIESDFLSNFNGGHHFKGLFLNAGLQSNSNFIGIDIDPSGANNNENFVIEDTNINCSGSFAQLRSTDDGVMASGSTTLTSATAVFNSGMAGKVIRVGKAGAGGITLVSTIAAYVSPTQVTLADANASGGNVSLARIHVGTGYGIGIRNGNNPNVKHNIVRNVGIQYASIGIYAISGSMQIYNYGGGYSLTGLKIGGISEPFTVHQMVTEGNLIEVDAGQTNANVHLTDCRGSNSSQLTEGFWKLDGQVIFDACHSESQPPPGGRIFNFSGAMNQKLTLNEYEFHNGPVSISESGLDTSTGEIRGSGISGIKGWPAGPFSGIPGSQYGLARYSGISSRPSPRDFAAIPGFGLGTSDSSNTGTAYPNANTLYYGGGALEIGGLHQPLTPFVFVRGTPGAVTRRFRLIARDSLTNRVISIDPSGNHAATTTCPTTLNGTNYLHFEWPAQYPAPTDYQLTEQNPSDVSQARVVATITPSGGNLETYDLQANPAGAYTASVIPTKNETFFEISHGGVASDVTATTTTYTVKPSDSVLTCDATAGNYTVTLPAAAAGNKGRRYTFKRIDASGNLPTISGGGTNIDGAATNVSLSSQWRQLSVASNGSQWLITEGDSLGVKTYVALLTQTAGNAPVATVLQNTLGGSVVWARSAQGVYTGTLVAAFTAAKTGVFISPLPHLSATASQIAEYQHTSADVITLQTMSQDGGVGVGTLNDGRLADTMIKIEVYP